MAAAPRRRVPGARSGGRLRPVLHDRADRVAAPDRQLHSGPRVPDAGFDARGADLLANPCRRVTTRCSHADTPTGGLRDHPAGRADESSGPPERDLFELARRLGSAPDGPIPRVVTSGPTGYEVGHQDDFTVTDLIDGRNDTVRASLKVVSEHAYWYVDDAAPLLTDDLELAAKAYESNIYPTVKDLFGEVWTPGVDNDPRLTILHTPLRGVVGYYSSRDEYPRQVRPESNQREMIYLDGRQVRPGTPVYLGVLTHELQHAVHWNFDAGEDGWVTEGMSEVAKDLIPS